MNEKISIKLTEIKTYMDKGTKQWKEEKVTCWTVKKHVLEKLNR